MRVWKKKIKGYTYSWHFNQNLHWLHLFLLYLPPDCTILNMISWGVSNCSFHKINIWPYRRATACLTANCLFTFHGLSGKVNYWKSKKSFLFFPTQMKRKYTHGPHITAIGGIWSFSYSFITSSNEQARAENAESSPKPEGLMVFSSTKLKPQICLMRFKFLFYAEEF